jgi:hypothetical protein
MNKSALPRFANHIVLTACCVCVCGELLAFAMLYRPENGDLSSLNQTEFVSTAARDLFNNVRLLIEGQKFVRTSVDVTTAYIFVPSICVLMAAF